MRSKNTTPSFGHASKQWGTKYLMCLFLAIYKVIFTQVASY